MGPVYTAKIRVSYNVEYICDSAQVPVYTAKIRVSYNEGMKPNPYLLLYTQLKFGSLTTYPPQAISCDTVMNKTAIKK